MLLLTLAPLGLCQWRLRNVVIGFDIQGRGHLRMIRDQSKDVEGVLILKTIIFLLLVKRGVLRPKAYSQSKVRDENVL